MGLFNRNSLSNFSNYKDIYYFLMYFYSKYNFDKRDYVSIINSLNDACLTCGSSFSSLKFFVNGNDSIVFQTDNFVFKLTEIYGNVNFSDYISHSKFILKPIYENKLILKDKSINILAFDKLNLNDISEDDVKNMAILLRHDGYLWYDPRVENLGKDSSGNVFLIDHGQLTYIADKSVGYVKHILADYRNYFKELDDIYNSSNVTDIASFKKR